MDITINNGSSIQVVGPSGAGKSLFVSTLLATPNYFKNPIQHIYWHMGVEEEAGMTSNHMKRLKNITYIKGIKPNFADKLKKHDVIVIDDLYDDVNSIKNFNDLFTKISRHNEITVIFITQNLFHQGGKHRTRNLNVQYLVIFKNPRDQTIINFLSNQAFPLNKKFLIDAFNDATSKPHGYLFIDFTQRCEDEIRVRADIFNKNGITIYKQKS